MFIKVHHTQWTAIVMSDHWHACPEWPWELYLTYLGSQSFTCKEGMTVSMYLTTWCKHGRWLWCQISHRILAEYNFSPCHYNEKLTSSLKTDFPLRWCTACLPWTVWVWLAFVLYSVSIETEILCLKYIVENISFMLMSTFWSSDLF